MTSTDFILFYFFKCFILLKSFTHWLQLNLFCQAVYNMLPLRSPEIFLLRPHGPMYSTSLLLSQHISPFSNILLIPMLHNQSWVLTFILNVLSLISNCYLLCRNIYISREEMLSSVQMIEDCFKAVLFSFK